MSHPMRTGYLLAIVTVLLWAGFVIFNRLAEASGLNGFDLTALRFGVAAVVLLPLWLGWQRIHVFNLRILTLTLVGGLGYALTAYWGFHYAPAVHGAVLISGILPFAVTVMAWLVLGEVPSNLRLFALLVIGLGVACIGHQNLADIGKTWPGDVLMATASLLWGLYTVLVKRWDIKPWEVTIGVALLSTALYLPVYALWLPKKIFTAPLDAIITQGIFQGIFVVIVAMVCFMQAMQRLGPTRLGAVMATVPATAGIAAVLILHEPFSWLLLAGLLLTSFGAWLGSRG